MVISIADTIFKDEQGSFVCNTQTPGCTNICYNDFSPISLLRYWALQVNIGLFVFTSLHVYPSVTRKGSRR